MGREEDSGGIMPAVCLGQDVLVTFVPFVAIYVEYHVVFSPQQQQSLQPRFPQMMEQLPHQSS